ncbi:hypothetical protein PAL_GLEAN10008189 [Pteropus alecto]|uniref:Uncharacterized protein n=1 Tax=Pteropus alecto TaxID=9402 RepID=L5K3Q0_PTEAL|nr:hypothetical protein PAL_GLEAN10008189 [Pteropus alecto]
MYESLQAGIGYKSTNLPCLTVQSLRYTKQEQGYMAATELFDRITPGFKNNCTDSIYENPRINRVTSSSLMTLLLSYYELSIHPPPDQNSVLLQHSYCSALITDALIS